MYHSKCVESTEHAFGHSLVSVF